MATKTLRRPPRPTPRPHRSALAKLDPTVTLQRAPEPQPPPQASPPARGGKARRQARAGDRHPFSRTKIELHLAHHGGRCSDPPSGAAGDAPGVSTAHPRLGASPREARRLFAHYALYAINGGCCWSSSLSGARGMHPAPSIAAGRVSLRRPQGSSEGLEAHGATGRRPALGGANGWAGLSCNHSLSRQQSKKLKSRLFSKSGEASLGLQGAARRKRPRPPRLTTVEWGRRHQTGPQWRRPSKQGDVCGGQAADRRPSSWKS